MADGVGAEPNGPVGNGERLYRRVDPGKVDQRTGRPLNQAFGPIEKGMSVNRAELCGCDPARVKDKSEDYVCSATAWEVRNRVTVDRRNPKGIVLETHKGEVTATPLPANKAHADVHETRSFPNNNLYRKLKASLAQVFNWEDGFAP